MKKPTIKAIAAKVNVAALRDLPHKRWGVKKRPTPAPVQPLIVLATTLSPTQITWLRQLERVKRMRVFAFLQTPAPTPFTALLAAKLPTVEDAIAVVRTMVHTRDLRFIPVLRLDPGATGLARLRMHPLASLPVVPLVDFPSLAEPRTEQPAPGTPHVSLALCGEPALGPTSLQLLPTASPGSVDGPRVSIRAALALGQPM